ncbi:protein of unknown function (plasmid) [Cupriavidus taiwanensis]|uniref:Uncharacterized protein n=1 Tax=Cupriavidus taiwanensis TaxID=164546 RepID=A0A375IUX0_9BURK|nr:protein of unknown function [Cupriavidus taiwanensis]
MLQMKQRRRIYYTETRKALMWERWRKGETLTQSESGAVACCLAPLWREARPSRAGLAMLRMC